MNRQDARDARIFGYSISSSFRPEAKCPRARNQENIKLFWITAFAAMTELEIIRFPWKIHSVFPGALAVKN
ncbi:MAG: hypothetical protein A3E57_03425 [Candidatus Muproteobacteria bacterium RIFCSPHIGHO2_12_FULL_60_33]|uniref:Uncharacterized protein n=1 Tax=Candidatus Muproteobacteria bacterium RIFCSPLOWO2_01_FULL_60_18 TaxID=1817768 RepID=A0A1F6TYV7_9PROT|nr:MAG: hypothetical protein A2W42_01770 [Candidatus Muproteobacteria bacterium RIFCSPHIGHO2_01_60_12]OGI50303.1 MAG: hypothetical protein A3A87_09350 [Candidatus Muproteobacteria bacterium RIFCSPLOWO2_01_FULL_60_18]OGI53984.1 MAG: hypothetical protein A3E57_03425 [Candidatus Muproteobacteria bacterium RIFCSPHIGHO2_12_FULL_60_33]OGI54154.1 MAG: hypothetical protein A3D32_01415 [Candidatus Muproteobacteria bacterium RIFCSPHIGHO2_02_FULL_60_13]OGI59235.1 MAG: hypothetical protein A2809_02150 [Can